MAEWSIALVLKTADVKASVSSNLTLSPQGGLAQIVGQARRGHRFDSDILHGIPYSGNLFQL